MRMEKFMVLLAIVFVMACTSQPESPVTSKEVWPGVQKSLNAGRQTTPEQKEHVTRSIEEKLETISSELEALKARAAVLDGEVRGNLVGALHTLENRAKDLQIRLAELRGAAADQWELMREEMNAAMKDLEEASRYFAGRVPA